MPAPTPYTSPDVRNYFIGKGNVYVKDVGAADGTYKHVGNVPKFEFIPKLEKKQHFSHMTGTKTLDKTVFVAKQAEVQFSLEEITPDNLVLALLNVKHTDTTGDYWNLLEAARIEKTVKLTGTNDVGSHLELILFDVFFAADKALSLIGDDWAAQEIVGDCLAVSGNFGTLRFLTNGA